jgi:hypothetical protein
MIIDLSFNFAIGTRVLLAVLIVSIALILVKYLDDITEAIR